MRLSRSELSFRIAIVVGSQLLENSHSVERRIVETATGRNEDFLIVLSKQLHVLPDLGTWPYEAHIARADVNKLWQFINVGRA